jgi:hypothetical protein
MQLIVYFVLFILQTDVIEIQSLSILYEHF